MFARLLVGLVIALLCATPAAVCAVDEPDASCLVDDAIATETLAPLAAPRLVAARPIAAADRPAPDPVRGRVFRPPRAA